MVRILDIGLDDVIDFFEGAGGNLREMVLGEHTHVGGILESEILALKAGIAESSVVLDVACGIGGPARFLGRRYGCKVVGLDASPATIRQAEARSAAEGIEDKVIFRVGDALHMPFTDHTFSVVWGQDAWCYVLDKEQLIAEIARVLKPHGRVAFTDWVETDKINDDERMQLNEFMTIPYLESCDGYVQLLKQAGFSVEEAETLDERFTEYVGKYATTVSNVLRDIIIKRYSESVFERLNEGVQRWLIAAQARKVTQCRIVASLMG